MGTEKAVLHSTEPLDPLREPLEPFANPVDPSIAKPKIWAPPLAAPSTAARGDAVAHGPAVPDGNEAGKAPVSNSRRRPRSDDTLDVKGVRRIMRLTQGDF